MPLVTVTAIQPKDPNTVSRMLKEIRAYGSKAYECDENNIWVLYQPVRSEFYLQQEDRSEPQSPLVTIKAKSGRARDNKNALAKAVSEAVGRAFAIPAGNVWIHYQEMNPEDVWYEGQ